MSHNSSGSEIDPNGNDLRIDESQLRHNTCRSIPCHCFDTEVRELFKVPIQEQNEPRNVKKALSSPLEKRSKAIEDEKESMKVKKACVCLQNQFQSFHKCYELVETLT